MDYPMFLNVSGGIVTPADGGYEWPLGVVPHFETVLLPVVSVDSAALYGDRPEDLMTVTISSGAALTFYVDSVAGGNDSSGDGSFDRPWRSLNAASEFISCAECMLNAAAPYIQLKVRGTVDYLSGYFDPKPRNNRNLIIAGWGGICDFDASGRSPQLNAGYIFRARAGIGNARYARIASDAIVTFGASTLYALDSEIDTAYGLGGIYNCSTGSSTSRVSARICSGGSFSGDCCFDYACAPRVEGRDLTLYVSSAVAGAVVSRVGGLVNPLNGGVSWAMSAYRAYVRDCRVTAVAMNSGGSTAVAGAGGIADGIVSGGTVAVSAFAAASGGEYPFASAVALGLGSSVSAHGVQVTVSASAGVRITGESVKAYEQERTGNLTAVCFVSRTCYVSGGLVTSRETVSGGVCP